MKKYLLPFLYSLLVSIIIGAPLRGTVGFVYSTIIESVFYVVITYFLLKKYSKTNQETLYIAGLIILGRIILEMPLRLLDFEHTLVSLPGTLLACSTIILTALVFMIRNIYFLTLSLIVWGYCIFIGHNKILEYMKWGPPLKAQVGNLTINTPKGNIPLKTIKSEYILLDFWISKCGVCYEKFPDFQSLYNKNKNEITIASVFVPYFKNEQISDGKAILDKCGYTFPVWSVSPTDTLLKTLKINIYPTIILLDKDKNVIFRGNLENAKKKLEGIINL